MSTIALIVAAGRGTRFAPSGLPKQYQKLGSKPVLRWCLEAFENHPEISKIAVVVHPQDIDIYAECIDGLQKMLPPIVGGVTRQESVARGLEELKNHSPRFVLIHDAVRPFVTNELVDRILAALKDHKAVLPALAVTDTIHQKNPKNQTQRLLERQYLAAAQTPQGFFFEAIVEAHKKAATATVDFTDDVAVIQAFGTPAQIVEGDPRNIKITSPEDILRLEQHLYPTSRLKFGQGFDVHRFKKGKSVRLGGIDIPFDKSLDGHSDADVVLHAICDAMLGCISAGDIGVHFPPHDEKWRGVDSAVLVAEVLKLLAQNHASLQQADITVLAEAPKIGPHRDQMLDRLAEILQLPRTAINVKATTLEGLGFIGRGEGIAAQAIVSVRIEG
ncbi:MAG: bifunctional 2-C-methyl-D-erythritol 4-phosphate cytidylyltransferase/2-C-methyl-D-erythritol 2,4-cyclodiphosphate synthase [Dongiaceae bacterium]